MLNAERLHLAHSSLVSSSHNVISSQPGSAYLIQKIHSDLRAEPIERVLDVISRQCARVMRDGFSPLQPSQAGAPRPATPGV